MSNEFRPLCGATSRDSFLCGQSEIDGWFRKKALRDHLARKHMTTCARLSPASGVMGFYALSSVSESAKNLPDVRHFPLETNTGFPCVQLVYLAVQKPMQGSGHGTIIMGHLIRRFVEIGSVIGIPAMIVIPINKDASRFYGRLGFEPYPKLSRMFLPLQTAIATVEEAQREI